MDSIISATVGFAESIDDWRMSQRTVFCLDITSIKISYLSSGGMLSVDVVKNGPSTNK